jgi:hypothetical protein
MRGSDPEGLGHADDSGKWLHGGSDAGKVLHELHAYGLVVI